NRALELSAERGLRFVMGYEEALGYTVGPVVRDKDGISAAAIFCELSAWLKSQGRSVPDYLDEIQARFGKLASLQKSVTFAGPEGVERIATIMRRFRERPPSAI